MPGTNVYVDGLNFYYGAVRRKPELKWIDFEALARLLVPQDQIHLIRYFTAIVKPGHPGDKAHERQNAFVRAIEANPLIEVTLGHFRSDVRWRVLAEHKFNPPDLARPTLRPNWIVRAILADARRRRTEPVTVVRVVDPEEKGSDVNLGAHLLHDVLKGGCRKAVVITNDSDLAEPIRLAVADGAQVGIVNPHPGSTSTHLKRVASFVIPFRPNVIAQCQMPDQVVGTNGKPIRRPKEWV